MQLPPKLMFSLSRRLRKICSLCEDRMPPVISTKDFRFALEDRFGSSKRSESFYGDYLMFPSIYEAKLACGFNKQWKKRRNSSSCLSSQKIL